MAHLPLVKIKQTEKLAIILFKLRFFDLSCARLWNVPPLFAGAQVDPTT